MNGDDIVIIRSIIGEFDLSDEQWQVLERAIKALKQQPNRCDSCIHSEEQDGSNCYECVKGMADNFETQQTDVDCISRKDAIKHFEDNIIEVWSKEEIADELGFTSANYMIASFFHYYRMTPDDYRNSTAL